MLTSPRNGCDGGFPHSPPPLAGPPSLFRCRPTAADPQLFPVFAWSMQATRTDPSRSIARPTHALAALAALAFSDPAPFSSHDRCRFQRGTPNQPGRACGGACGEPPTPCPPPPMDGGLVTAYPRRAPPHWLSPSPVNPVNPCQPLSSRHTSPSLPSPLPHSSLPTHSAPQVRFLLSAGRSPVPCVPRLVSFAVHLLHHMPPPHRRCLSSDLTSCPRPPPPQI